MMNDHYHVDNDDDDDDDNDDGDDNHDVTMMLGIACLVVCASCSHDSITYSVYFHTPAWWKVLDTGVFSSHSEFQRAGGVPGSRVEEGYAAKSVRNLGDGAEDCTG